HHPFSHRSHTRAMHATPSQLATLQAPQTAPAHPSVPKSPLSVASPPFSPTADQLAQIMRDLTDPFLSFTDIADGNNTTVNALSAFLARPDMQQEIKDLENNIAARARIV